MNESLSGFGPFPPGSGPGARSEAADTGPLRITAAEDVLAFVPHLLGFIPTRSLVLLGLRGTRLGPAIRIDLPAAGPRPGYAADAVRLLRGDSRTDSLLMVLYAPEKDTVRGGAWSGLPADVANEATAAGLELRDGWMVGARTWRSCFCDDESCCSSMGQATAALVDSRLSAEMVFRGSVAAGSLADALDRDLAASAVRLREPDPVPASGSAVRAPARQGFSSTRRLLNGWWQHAYVLPRLLREWNAALQEAGEGMAPRPEQARLLAASLGNRAVRDLLPVLMAVGLEAAVSGAHAAGLLTEGPLPVTVRRSLQGGPDRSEGPAKHWDLASAGSAAAVPDPGPASGTTGTATLPGSPGSSGRLLAEVLTGQWAGRPDWQRMDEGYTLLAWFSAAGCGRSNVGGNADGQDGLGGKADGQGPDGQASVDGDGEVPGSDGRSDGQVGPGQLSGGIGSDSGFPPEPAVAALLAWLEWARGRGSRAQELLERCLVIDPGYRLALLMQELFATGTVPRWAQSEHTAWDGRREREAS